MNERTAEITGAEDVSWNLNDLYSAVDDASIRRDLDDADQGAARLRERFYGKIAGLEPAEMRALLEEYERINELDGKVGSYAYLLWSANTEDPARGALLQKATERSARLGQELVFFELEWANTPDEAAERLLSSPELARYRHFLEAARRYRPHLLSESEEKILAEKSVTGRSAWTRFFSEVHGAARYAFDGERLPREKVMTRLYDPERETRKRAASAITTGLQDLQRTTTYVFNNVLADKASDDRLRRYPSWISGRNLANEVDDAVVEALINAVTSRYDIVARYYRLKRRLLGLDQLFDYDRYAPLPAADRRYPWDEGRDIVLNAYARFHPQMAEVAHNFFEKEWIDAAVRPGKLGGAYSHSTVPSVHPYVLINYEARPRDVMTLAHELGHGVHQWLARKQGLLQAHTPLTMAEMASTFGERLVFEDLMARESDKRAQLALLTATLEDAFATVFRQISMNRFEDAIHTARRQEGELTAARFGELWMTTQRAMFADSVTLTDNYGLWWSYIPHFINTPGYVYAYAFGQLLVLALYARYRELGNEFAPLYLDMLAAGGSDWPPALVKPLGVDLTDLNFWHKGLGLLDEMVGQAEQLAA